jgi:hypothetical protein
MSESIQSGRTYLPRRLPPLLLVSGAPEVLEEFHMSGTAQTKPKLHARLRHLRTGRLTEHTFSEGKRVPIADAQYRRAQFSYHDGQRPSAVVPTPLGNRPVSTPAWKSRSRSSSPLARKSAWTQPHANTPDAKARGRDKHPQITWITQI